eukprot:TRINITY_DN9966_c0_g1_i2.p1 TRINITY_DN9966_c0_g1~~TRINITY_DN9966_c0_g1_i2.p1  ORF type:complete len:2344 (-),score=634.51 TRINITY_DN9966_c0_g1_i2:5785-12648(-)
MISLVFQCVAQDSCPTYEDYGIAYNDTLVFSVSSSNHTCFCEGGFRSRDSSVFAGGIGLEGGMTVVHGDLHVNGRISQGDSGGNSSTVIADTVTVNNWLAVAGEATFEGGMTASSESGTTATISSSGNSTSDVALAVSTSGENSTALSVTASAPGATALSVSGSVSIFGNFMVNGFDFMSKAGTSRATAWFSSCAELKQFNPNAKSGIYWMSPENAGGDAVQTSCDMENNVFYKSCAELHAAFPTAPAGLYTLKWSNAPTPIYCRNNGTLYTSCAALKAAHGYTWNQQVALAYLGVGDSPVPVATLCDFSLGGAYATPPTSCAAFKGVYTGYSTVVSGPAWISYNGIPTSIPCDFTGAGALYPTCDALKTGIQFPQDSLALHYLGMAGSTVPVATACNLAATPAVVATVPATCAKFKALPRFSTVISGPTWLSINGTAPAPSYCDFSGPGLLFTTCHTAYAAFWPTWVAGQFWLQWSNAPVKTYCDENGLPYSGCGALKAAVPSLSGGEELHYLGKASTNTIPVATICNMTGSGSTSVTPPSCSALRSMFFNTVSGPAWLSNFAAAPTIVYCDMLRDGEPYFSCPALFTAYTAFNTLIAGQYWMQWSNAPVNAYCDATGNFYQNCTSLKMFLGASNVANPSLQYLGITGMVSNIPIAVSCNMATTGTYNTLLTTCALFKAQTNFSNVVNGPTYLSVANGNIGYCEHTSGTGVFYKSCGLLKTAFPRLPQGQYWLQWSNVAAFVHCSAAGELFTDCAALKTAFPVGPYITPYYLSMGTALQVPVAVVCDMTTTGVLATPPTTCAAFKGLSGYTTVATGAAYIKYFPHAYATPSPVMCDFSGTAMVATCTALKTLIPFLSSPYGMYHVSNGGAVPVATACDMTSTGAIAAVVPKTCADFKAIPGFGTVSMGPVYLNYSTALSGGVPGIVYCDYFNGDKSGMLFPTCMAMHGVFSSPTRPAGLHWLQWSERPAPVYCDASGVPYQTCTAPKSAFGAGVVGTSTNALFYLSISLTYPGFIPVATVCDMNSGVYATPPDTCEDFRAQQPSVVSGPSYIKWFAGVNAGPSPVVCDYTRGVGVLAPNCSSLRTLLPWANTTMWYIGTGGKNVPVATHCDMMALAPATPQSTCALFRTAFPSVSTGPVWLSYGGVSGIAYCNMVSPGALYPSCETLHAQFTESPSDAYWLQWSTTSPAVVFCHSSGFMYANCSVLKQDFPSLPAATALYYLSMPSITTPVATGCDMSVSPAVLAPVPDSCASFKGASYSVGVSWALVSGTARIKAFANIAPAALMCDFSSTGVMMLTCANAKTFIASLSGTSLAYLGITGGNLLPVASSCNWGSSVFVTYTTCNLFRTTPGHSDVLTGPTYLSLSGNTVYCDHSGPTSVMFPTCETRAAVFPLTPSNVYWLQWSNNPAQVYCNATGAAYPSCLALKTAWPSSYTAANALVYLANDMPDTIPVATLCNMVAPGSPYAVASTPTTCLNFKASYTTVVSGPTMLNVGNVLTRVYCDGTTPAVPYPSCRALFAAYPSLNAGVFTLQWSNVSQRVYCDHNGELFQTCADLKTFVGGLITANPTVVYLGMNSSSPIPVAVACDMSGPGVLAPVPVGCSGFRSTYGVTNPGPVWTSHYGIDGIAYCDANPVLHTTCTTLRNAFPSYAALVAGPYWLQWSNAPVQVYCNGTTAYPTCGALGTAFPELVGYATNQIHYLQQPGMPVPTAVGCDMASFGTMGYSPFPATCAGFNAAFGTSNHLVTGPTLVKSFQNAPPAPLMCDFVSSGGVGVLMASCNAVKTAMPTALVVNPQLLYINVMGTGLPVAAACDMTGAGAFTSVVQNSCANFKAQPNLNAVVSGPAWVLHDVTASVAYCDFSGTGALYPTCQTLTTAFPHLLGAMGQYWQQWSSAPANIYCTGAGALFADCSALKAAVPALTGATTLQYLQMGNPHDIPVAVPCDMTTVGATSAIIPATCTAFKSTTGLTTTVNGMMWCKPNTFSPPIPVMCLASVAMTTCAAVKTAVSSLTTASGLFYLYLNSVTYPVATPCDMSGTGVTSTNVSRSCAEFKARPGFSSVATGATYLSYAPPAIGNTYCNFNGTGRLFSTCMDIKTMFTTTLAAQMHWLHWSEDPTPVWCNAAGAPYQTCALLKTAATAAVVGTNATTLAWLGTGSPVNIPVATVCDFTGSGVLGVAPVSCASFKALYPSTVSGATMIKPWANALAPAVPAICDFRNDSAPVLAPNCASIRDIIPLPTSLTNGTTAMWYVGSAGSTIRWPRFATWAFSVCTGHCVYGRVRACAIAL